MKLINRVVVTPGALKLINVWAGNPPASTISGGSIKLKMLAASLPENPGIAATVPLRPVPAMSALLARVAGGSLQLIHRDPGGQPANPPFATVMLPAMLKVPVRRGAA